MKVESHGKSGLGKHTSRIDKHKTKDTIPCHYHWQCLPFEDLTKTNCDS